MSQEKSIILIRGVDGLKRKNILSEISKAESKVITTITMASLFQEVPIIASNTLCVIEDIDSVFPFKRVSESPDLYVAYRNFLILLDRVETNVLILDNGRYELSPQISARISKNLDIRNTFTKCAYGLSASENLRSVCNKQHALGSSNSKIKIGLDEGIKQEMLVRNEVHYSNDSQISGDQSVTFSHIKGSLPWKEIRECFSTSFSKHTLLYGSPGTGKTMLVRAAANELSCNLISVTIPDVISAELGESEASLSKFFDQAKKSAPCILFFDEIDTIFPKIDNNYRWGRNLVTQFKLEMERISHVKVLIVGATNHPELVDTSLLRHGRIYYQIHIPVPLLEDLIDFLHEKKIDHFFTHEQLKRLEGLTFADLRSILRTIQTRQNFGDGIENIKLYLENMILALPKSGEFANRANEKCRTNVAFLKP